MNEDAFARRFYADRAELESLGHPADGRQARRRRRRAGELLAAAGELPPARDRVHRRGARVAADRARRCSTASSPTPSRCGSRSSRSPGAARARCSAPDQRASRSASPASAGGHDLSQRLAKVETAIFRHKTITFDYYTMERDDGRRRARSTPTTCSSRAASSTSLGHSHERDAMRVFRLSRIRGKVAYATKAEHDFKRPADFDPRAYANRAEWQFGDAGRHRRGLGLRAHRLAGRAPLRPLRRGRAAPTTAAIVFATAVRRTRASSRRWVLGARRARARRRARRSSSPRSRERVDAARRAPRPTGSSSPPPVPPRAPTAPTRRPPSDGNGAPRREPRSAPSASRASSRSRRSSSRPAARGERLRADDVCERLQISDAELREDVNVLNVVNFGGGSYVLYAEVARRRDDRGRPRAVLRQLRPPRAAAARRGQGARRRDRPDRRAPARGRADVARARRSSPRSAPTRREQGLQVADARRRRLRDRARRLARRSPTAGCCGSSTTRPNEDEFSERVVEPYALINGREGWYVAVVRPAQGRRAPLPPGPHQGRPRSTDERFEPRPEVDPAADVDGWPRTGEVPASRIARVWISPERARWAREERRVAEELADGAVVVELPLRGHRLARARGAQGGRRRRGARARPTPARRCRAAVAAAARPACRAAGSRDEPPRPDHDDRRRRSPPSSTSSGSSSARRTGRDGWPAPDAALVRRPRRRAVGLDVRQVPEGPQPRARPARDAAGRDRRAVPGAARRDARVRRRRSHRDVEDVAGVRARDLRPLRAAWTSRRRGRRWSPQQAPKRVGLQFVERAPRDLGPPQARHGVY